MRSILPKEVGPVLIEPFSGECRLLLIILATLFGSTRVLSIFREAVIVALSSVAYECRQESSLMPSQNRRCCELRLEEKRRVGAVQ
jgi:hypothetical protein